MQVSMEIDQPRDPPSPQRSVRWASGLLVMFAAIGFGAWFSGAASWAGFYLGARGRALTTLAQATAVIGFALGVFLALAWYRRRCRRGSTAVPARAVLTACAILPAGNIFWAIFVDAIAYHYGQDIVRPAFDTAIMYVILGGLLPLSVGVPWLVSWACSRATPRPAAA